MARRMSFNDYVQTTNPQGTIRSFTSPGGDVLSVTDYSGNHITEMQRSVRPWRPVTTIDSWLYRLHVRSAAIAW